MCSLSADVSCVSGCECAATRLDGHWDEPSSGTWGHPFTVSQNADCVLRIKVVPTASAGSSKVRNTPGTLHSMILCSVGCQSLGAARITEASQIKRLQSLPCCQFPWLMALVSRSPQVMLTELIVLDDPVAPRTLDREAFQQPATSDRAVDRSEQQAEE